MKFSDNILLYTLVPLVILLAGASCTRFIIQHDYLVTYEGECDEFTQSCFIGCEDDECTEVFYYTIVKKHAADLYSQCGSSIIECDFANICLPQNDEQCSITYCDSSTDDCEEVTHMDSVSNYNESSLPTVTYQ